MTIPPQFTRMFNGEGAGRTRRVTVLCLIAGFLMVSSMATAQGNPRVGIMVSDEAGLTASELTEFSSGVEQIARDYGVFEVVSSDELLQRLDRSEQRDLLWCGSDTACYGELLYPEVADFLLRFQVDTDIEGLVVTIDGINLRDGRVESTQQGFLPGPSETMFLLVPIHESLARLDEIEIEPASESETPRVSDERDRHEVREEPILTEVAGQEESNLLAIGLEIGGAGVMLGGIVFWILADDTLQEIQAEPHDRDELTDLQNSGDTYETIGNIAVATGAAMVVTGLVFDLLGIGASNRGDSAEESEQGWTRVDFSGSLAGPTIELEMSF